MTTGLEIEPPRCVNTGAVKTICCAGIIDEDDQPDTIERQEAGVQRHNQPRMDWCGSQ